MIVFVEAASGTSWLDTASALVLSVFEGGRDAESGRAAPSCRTGAEVFPNRLISPGTFCYPLVPRRGLNKIVGVDSKATDLPQVA